MTRGGTVETDGAYKALYNARFFFVRAKRITVFFG